MGDMREESALNMFRQMDLKGKAKDDTQLKTVHQNTIATIRSYDEAGGSVKKFSSKLPHSNNCLESLSNFPQQVAWMEKWLFGLCSESRIIFYQQRVQDLGQAGPCLRNL